MDIFHFYWLYLLLFSYNIFYNSIASDGMIVFSKKFLTFFRFFIALRAPKRAHTMRVPCECVVHHTHHAPAQRKPVSVYDRQQQPPPSTRKPIGLRLSHRCFSPSSHEVKNMQFHQKEVSCVRNTNGNRTVDERRVIATEVIA